MSYILEALKKLEEKRRGTPGIASIQALPLAERRRPLWPFLLILVLFLNAGILVWWLKPWQDKKAGPSVTTVPPSPAAGPAVPPPAAPQDHAFAGRGPERHVATARGTAPSEAEQEYPQPAGAPSTGRQASAKGKILSIDDLPPSVRRSVPDIAISGHFYSDRPPARVVLMDGKVMHEGDSLPQGLKLERITPDGVVLNWQGHRFQKGVF